MSDPVADMTRSFKEANKSQQAFTSYSMEFQAACLRFDWKAAQVAHRRAVDSMDGYFDNLAAAYKRQEAAESGR